MEIQMQDVMDRIGKKLSQAIIDNEVLSLQIEKMMQRIEELEAQLEPQTSDSVKDNGAVEREVVQSG